MPPLANSVKYYNTDFTKRQENGGKITEVKKKKMGRPTTNPKTKRLEIRLSESENNLLEECVRRTGRDRTAVIVKGIAMVYNSTNQKTE